MEASRTRKRLPSESGQQTALVLLVWHLFCSYQKARGIECIHYRMRLREKSELVNKTLPQCNVPTCQAETETRDWEGGSQGRLLCRLHRGLASDVRSHPACRQLAELTCPKVEPTALRPHSQALQMTAQAVLTMLPSGGELRRAAACACHREQCFS